MARGQKKPVEEKIAAKEELISALLTRVEAEKKELEALYDEKRTKDLGVVSEMIDDAGLSPDEAREALQLYIVAKRAEFIKRFSHIFRKIFRCTFFLRFFRKIPPKRLQNQSKHVI